MKIYYAAAEAPVGEHRILTAVYDEDDYRTNTASMPSFLIYEVDQSTALNRSLCTDLYNTTNVEGTIPPATAVRQKYYINTSTQLVSRDGWVRTEHH